MQTDTILKLTYRSQLGKETIVRGNEATILEATQAIIPLVIAGTHVIVRLSKDA